MTDKEIADWYNDTIFSRYPLQEWTCLISYLLKYDHARFYPINNRQLSFNAVLKYKKMYNDTILEYDIDTVRTLTHL